MSGFRVEGAKWTFPIQKYRIPTRSSHENTAEKTARDCLEQRNIKQRKRKHRNRGKI
jgi:hypothetical protein